MSHRAEETETTKKRREEQGSKGERERENEKRNKKLDGFGEFALVEKKNFTKDTLMVHLPEIRVEGESKKETLLSTCWELLHRLIFNTLHHQS